MHTRVLRVYTLLTATILRATNLKVEHLLLISRVGLCTHAMVNLFSSIFIIFTGIYIAIYIAIYMAMLDSQVIRWAAPFDFAQPRPPKPPKPPTPPGQELALPALEDQFRSEELKRSLEAMMKDAGAG